MHTPAPWSVMFRDSRAREFGCGIWLWEVPVTVGFENNPGNVIALVGMGGPGAATSTKESVEANARLIAAAPDLLAALKSLLDYDIREDCRRPYTWDSLVGKAVAAIAKAEGDSKG